MTHPLPAESEVRALRGHQFPGGEYTIEHWENFLLTECTGAELMPDGLVHPVALFHIPILGSRTSIAEMFALGQAESDLSILIESYDWELLVPLRENHCYRVSGAITEAQRLENDEGKPYDRIQFEFELHEQSVLTARVTVIWHYTRNTL
ncbi:MAG: hypothetical protein V7754_07375 [Halioglobus sp.]